MTTTTPPPAGDVAGGAAPPGRRLTFEEAHAEFDQPLLAHARMLAGRLPARTPVPEGEPPEVGWTQPPFIPEAVVKQAFADARPCWDTIQDGSCPRLRLYLHLYRCVAQAAAAEAILVYRPELLRHLNGLAGGPNFSLAGIGADDLIHDVYERVMRRWETINPPRPYLHRAVRNAYFAAWNASPRRGMADESIEASADVRESDSAEIRELEIRLVVQEMAKELPAVPREVFYRRAMLDQPAKKVAAVMDKTPSAVDSAYDRAKRQLVVCGLRAVLIVVFVALVAGAAWLLAQLRTVAVSLDLPPVLLALASLGGAIIAVVRKIWQSETTRVKIESFWHKGL